MMEKIFTIIILVSLAFMGWSQADPVVHINFDNCTGEDVQGGLSDYIQSSTIDCDCGISGEGVYFDGAMDSLHLDEEIIDLFNNDFTFSMYFWVDDAPQPYTVFGIQGDCSKDSVFLVKYLPQIKELDVQIAKNFGLGAFLIGPINEDLCWHHIIFTKFGKEYSLTVDGVFIETKTLTEEIVMGTKHQIRLGGSPCVGIQESNMNGRIDEIKIWDYPLTLEEQAALNVFEDQIITQDTTIFEGDIFPIRTGGTCAPNFSWSPGAGLSSTSVLEPEASPTESVTYFWNIDHGTCLTRDSIDVFVIDDNEIDCSNLLLPNVFTPNDDDLNDLYTISNNFIIEDLNYFEIYDRWGAKVFETMTKDDGWDGMFNGIEQAPSMYVYKIEYTCRGETFQKAGNFTLLK